MMEAMAMMERLQGMDELEAQMRAAQNGEGLDDIDADKHARRARGRGGRPA